jgi:hypothetical protein
MHCPVVLSFDQPTKRFVCTENVSPSSENLHMSQLILVLSEGSNSDAMSQVRGAELNSASVLDAHSVLVQRTLRAVNMTEASWLAEIDLSRYLCNLSDTANDTRIFVLAG